MIRSIALVMVGAAIGVGGALGVQELDLTKDEVAVADVEREVARVAAERDDNEDVRDIACRARPYPDGRYICEMNPGQKAEYADTITYDATVSDGTIEVGGQKVCNHVEREFKGC